MAREPVERPGVGAPLRVTHLMRRRFPGHFSIERVFAQLRPALAEQGYDVDVVVAGQHSKGIGPRMRTAREARRLDAPVVHVTGDINYAGVLRPRRRTILTVHDTEFLERASPAKRWIYTWVWLRLPVWRAQVVTVPTEATRVDVSRHVRVRPGKIRVVPNPVAEELVAIPSPSVPPWPEVPTVLVVGTRPNKNLERSIAAVAGLRCRLLVIGMPDDAQRAALAQAGIDAEIRTDLGDGDLRACYEDADVVLFPSTKEGFGIPVLEAQAMGRPVVTSTRSPLPEVAGGAAELVDPLDVASIRAGVERVLGDADRRADLVRRGRANVAGYRVAGVAARYGAIYDEVARRS